MAEALAALGVAASVAQFTTIGIKAASLIREAYESTNGLVEEQQDLDHISRNIQDQCTALQAQDTTDMGDSFAELLQASDQLATDLEEELGKLKRASDVGCMLKTRQSLRALRRKSKIEQIQRRLFKLRDQVLVALASTTR